MTPSERFWTYGHYTPEELEAAQPAPPIKDEWVWECPFCHCRNYYRAIKCKRKGCETVRVLFQDGKRYAVPFLSKDKVAYWPTEPGTNVLTGKIAFKTIESKEQNGTQPG